MTTPWTTDLADRIDLLHRQAARLAIDDRIVDWEASLVRRDVETLLLTNGGGRIDQRFHFVYPSLRATANDGPRTQTADARCRLVQRSGRHGGPRPLWVR